MIAAQIYFYEHNPKTEILHTLRKGVHISHLVIFNYRSHSRFLKIDIFLDIPPIYLKPCKMTLCSCRKLDWIFYEKHNSG